MHRVRVYAAVPTPVTIATDPQVSRSVVPLCEHLRMTSTALRAWRSQRAERLDRLVSAHATVGGSGPGRRWLTEELNHALVLRLATEFQGFARDLHDEASDAIASALSAGVPERGETLIALFSTTRRLNRGNASPDVLAHDFGLFGMRLWEDLQQRFPTRASQWQERLLLLNSARNGLAHADTQRIEKVVNAGWPPTLQSVRRWRSTLEALSTGIDHATGEHLDRVFGSRAW
jgi:hypothetical protein